MTSTEVVEAISQASGIARKDVRDVLKAQAAVAAALLHTAPGDLRIPIIPGAVAIYKHKRPASKARTGLNPATGEPIKIKAKPARWVVKAAARKALKEAV